jgi:hypothetical protein
MNHRSRLPSSAPVLLAGLLSIAPALLLDHAVLRGECLNAFQRGDSNLDGRLDLSDGIATLGFLFLGTGDLGCDDAADADDNARLDITDAIYTVTHLFLGGPALPPPRLGECGVDATQDGLACLSYPPCVPVGEDSCTSNDCCDIGSYCEKGEDDCDGIGSCVLLNDICPRIFDPWCGCDGVTYGNRCMAGAAGVNVVHRGECGKVPCTTNDECDIGSYCAHPEADCTEPGSCEVRPVGCEKIFDPVCGCDGATYGNPCEAASVGVSIAYHGECRVGTPCGINEECGGAEYCQKIAGRCDEPGVCESLPDLCAQFFDPVCGCDGLTYGNDCLAAQAGVNVAFERPCDAGPECSSSEECEEGSYCYKPEGFCDDVGYCTAPDPTECDGVPRPVCGCDGVTYDDHCLAALAGTSVQKQEPCEQGADCKSNEDCADGYMCFKKAGFCDEPGFCSRVPLDENCLDEPDDPVCGCDNQTYRTGCHASAAKVNVAYYGPCDGLPRCSAEEECEEGRYCAFREGHCAGLGLCTEPPAECPEDIVDPVCGCDNVTYLSPCFAARAGVSISFYGRCDGGNTDCETSAFCGGGSYCAKMDGDCDGPGSCETRPTDCDDTSDPVCGCDGITYLNECRANAEGVNVLRRGECP